MGALRETAFKKTTKLAHEFKMLLSSIQLRKRFTSYEVLRIINKVVSLVHLSYKEANKS